MHQSKILVSNRLGLHARASSKLAQLAARFQCKIQLGKDDQNMADAKSIMALMMMAAGQGTELTLQCDGKDEQEAQEAITKLFNDKFDEGE